MKKIMLFLFWSLLMQTSWAQALLDTRIDFAVENLSIPEAISQLAEESDIPISFSNNFFTAQSPITLTLKRAKISAVLKQILAGTGIEYQLVNQQVLLRRRAKVLKKYTISGYIQDAEDGEKLIAATIFSPHHQQGTISNEYGFFSLTLPAGPTALICSYLGSQEKKLDLDLTKNTPLQIELARSITLGEIVVKPIMESGQQLFSTSPNANEVAIKQLRRIPDLGGEPDLLRATQLLPGVQSGADGLGGLNVRGGNADQNLMLLDGVPIYNASHLMGIFSIFNTSAIREAKLIKGNFPARYGGRLSSVLDVRSREGNDRKWSGELQSGLISAKATVEGPIAGKRGALLLTGRRTHSTFLLDEVTRDAFFPNYSGPLQYNFHDLNAKVNFSIGSNDRIYFGLYTGGDVFRTTEEVDTLIADGSELAVYESSLAWGNLIGSFRWNHQFGSRLFANTTLTYSQYNYNNELLTEFFEEDIDGELVGDVYEFYSNGADIQDLAAKVDFDFVASPRHYWRFGLGWTRHRLAPGVGFFEGMETEFSEELDDLTLDDLENFFEFDVTEAHEWQIYVEDEFRLKNKWMLNLGLRLSGFLHPETIYFEPQPRLGIRYSINDQWSIHGGLSRMVQYLHRLAGIGISKPDDVWIPSTKIIKPQNSWQSGLSLHYSTSQKLDINLESYFKVMDNLVRFDDTTFFLNPENPIEENLVFGSGIAYGLELLVKKDFGKTGGHFAYTLANSKRQFPALNLGNDFSFLFDRRHQISLFVFHRFSKKWEVSAAFLYGSSHPLVALEENLTFGLETSPVNPNGQKNQQRNEGYHRFDITFLYQLPGPRFQHTLKAGLYNVYNQENDAFQRYQLEDGQEALESVSFMPILPSLSYMLKF